MMKAYSIILVAIITIAMYPLFAQSYKIHEQVIADFKSAEHNLVYVWLNDYVDIDQLRKNNFLNRQQTAKNLLVLLKEKSDKNKSILQSKITKELGNIPINWTYITNGFYIDADFTTIKTIANWPEVKGIFPEIKPSTNTTINEAPPSGSAQPGLKAINAHKMWELGYTGYGRKAYIFDSGEDYDHPALKSRFNGNISGFKKSWSGGGDRPFDVLGHGSHVTGTICGMDAINKDTIGVAFNATWIGGPIQFRTSPKQPYPVKTFLENFQYALNPDDDITTIDDMPDVINNSWGDTVVIQCNGHDPFTEVFKALELAGVAIVWSAGNNGPNSNTVMYYQGGLNYSLVSGFSVGATNNYIPYKIADFSSRGPSQCALPDLLSPLSIKPEVSAPGVGIRSAHLFGGYQNLNGTSMAAPHVSGAILLLKEAFPYLTGEDLLFALYDSAHDLGEIGEDNVYGKGFIDVYAAYLYLINDGNVPIPPLSNHKDIAVLDLIEENSKPYCKDFHSFSAVIYNNGLDTITAFDVEITSNNNGTLHFDTLQWTGTLSPGDTTLIVLPEQFFGQAGNSYLKVNITLNNPDVDNRNLNNVWLKEFEVINRTYPSIAVDAPQKACYGSNILLSAKLNENENFVPTWFVNESGGLPIGQGNLLYGPLYNNTTLFVEPLIHQNLDVSYDEVAKQSTTVKNTGLVFDVLENSYLQSVNVYILKAGLHVFNLVDDKGNVLKTLSKSFPLGTSNLLFNTYMPVGKDYKLLMAVSKEAGINVEDVIFPINIADVISIKSATGFTDEENKNTFALFFDWHISIAYPCGRTAFQVEVNESDTITAIDITLPDSINISTDNHFVIKPTIVDSTYQYNWSLTGNPNSTEVNLNAVFDTIGLYNCSLLVVANNGCSNFVTKQFTVFDDEISGIDDANLDTKYLLYPNPSESQFTIFTYNGIETVALTLVSTTGQGIMNLPHYRIGETVNIDYLNSGPYFLKIRDSKSLQTLKFFKI